MQRPPKTPNEKTIERDTAQNDFSPTYPISPVAIVKSDFKDKFGVPRQSGRAETYAEICFLPPYNVADAVRGIERFSHLWLIFAFSLNGAPESKPFSPLVRPPRLGGSEKTGVFASRSPFRPNALGLSCVKLLSVKQTKNGVILRVLGADLVDGTPVYDVKPYLPSSDKIENAVGGFSDEHALDALSVDFPPDLLALVPKEKQSGLLSCLADDPRPAYQNDPNRIYGMSFDALNVRFRVSNGVLTVVSVERLSSVDC